MVLTSAKAHSLGKGMRNHSTFQTFSQPHFLHCRLEGGGARGERGGEGGYQELRGCEWKTPAVLIHHSGENQGPAVGAQMMLRVPAAARGRSTAAQLCTSCAEGKLRPWTGTSGWDPQCTLQQPLPHTLLRKLVFTSLMFSGSTEAEQEAKASPSLQAQLPEAVHLPPTPSQVLKIHENLNNTHYRFYKMFDFATAFPKLPQE